MEVISVDDIFQTEDIDALFQYIFMKENARKWSINKHFWENDLQNKSPGSVSIFVIEGTAKDLIESKLQKYLKPGEKIQSVQYYEWHQMSQINWHNDSGKKASMTIYLNDTWNRDWGGFFCWKDENNQCHMIIPKFNSGIIARGNPEHHVSLVNPFAPTRKTLQIWIQNPL
jgi:Rps23 Pro-64 3,4-dihydroxylase Tpa1-like proline 4-hydroxylase